MERSLWKTYATARERAIAIVEDARRRGLLVGTVRDAIALRSAIVRAIETYSDDRARRAEARLTEDGYRECSECHEWYFGDDEEPSRLDETQGYCSRECRDAAEPLCLRCRDLPQCPDRADGYCSDACRRAADADIAADRAYDEWRDRQMEVA